MADGLIINRFDEGRGVALDLLLHAHAERDDIVWVGHCEQKYRARVVHGPDLDGHRCHTLWLWYRKYILVSF